MPVQCLELQDNGQILPVDTEAALTRRQSGDGLFWIDAHGLERDAQQRLFERLDVPCEMVDIMLEGGHAARVLPLVDVVYFELPMRQGTTLSPLRFVCLDRLLVTMSAKPLYNDRLARTDLARQLSISTPSISWLVCGLLIDQSATIRRTGLTLRQRALELSSAMDSDPLGVDLATILDLKLGVVELDAITEECEVVLRTLETVNKPLLDLVQLKDEFQIAISNTSSTDRRADRLERRVNDLQLRYDLHQQDKTNSRLGRLTVISAIFLPLTLLAGIYGMNFDVMPELHWPNGYYYVLGGMVLIGVGLYGWFRTRGWME